MLEESVPSIWASMAGWFTPAVLFVLVNVVIGTIAVTSKSALHGRRRGTEEGNEEEDQPHRPRALVRSPSVLQRLRSGVSLYRHSPPEPHRHLDAPAPAPSASAASAPAEGEAHVVGSLEEAFAAVARAAADEEEEEGHFRRSQSDSHTVKAAPAEEARGPWKLRKAASDVSALGRTEDGEIGMVTPPPLTAREWRSKKEFGLGGDEEEEEEEGGGGGGEEVDAKADDFINRFRKQLQLQRVESILRNKQMQQQ